ncbi:MAG: Uma2 family endonuclease [Verrucomicrobiaceae bacterium]|nr:Uma2 family endonuclease [Verrucomicrobiaceae bacterium]
MIIAPPTRRFETDKAGRIIYPVDNGEPLSNDTEHLRWITFVKNGLEDWFADRDDVFIAADLLWYPIEGRPDISKAPDVMVVLDHPAGPRSSYMQWEEKGRAPQVVFEFLSKSNTAGEMMDKLDFYSDLGCDEFYTYDYQRGVFSAFQRRSEQDGLSKVKPQADGTWKSPLLGMTFGLSADGRLWVRRPDGKLMETQREIARRAEAEAKRAEAETKRAEALASKLRELGIDPDKIA